MLKVSIAFVLAATLAVPVAAAPKTKPKPPKAATPACERASYPGDPVCDVGGGDAAGALPTPTDRQGYHEPERGMAVTDGLRLKGRSDFNNNRYGGTQLYNPNPNPSPLQDVNGGGGLDYKF